MCNLLQQIWQWQAWAMTAVQVKKDLISCQRCSARPASEQSALTRSNEDKSNTYTYSCQQAKVNHACHEFLNYTSEQLSVEELEVGKCCVVVVGVVVAVAVAVVVVVVDA